MYSGAGCGMVSIGLSVVVGVVWDVVGVVWDVVGAVEGRGLAVGRVLGLVPLPGFAGAVTLGLLSFDEPLMPAWEEVSPLVRPPTMPRTKTMTVPIAAIAP